MLKTPRTPTTGNLFKDESGFNTSCPLEPSGNCDPLIPGFGEGQAGPFAPKIERASFNHITPSPPPLAYPLIRLFSDYCCLTAQLWAADCHAGGLPIIRSMLFPDTFDFSG
ncbi:hypothetical protein HRR83_008648 [Exophiala dermatitidis]|uniref:Uncharacterized protein n=1 Tax=Exophiala dermatitidis TaxID=5970 RepID=A0AAN6ITY8_EXODE|nr:hypothetical protein HRR73_008463 [Exophiala dermatitidis]KAJ4505649.1 hypothetical protein HRR74_008560 [Exophiala dermatitidis]KAJ4536426.1 hypothetical protein HRR77_007345 [Exophiala dermatitidis]KAJ4541045.1 hypothetical protein HRR76_004424 [Exophiala dermatitidis]KAJ4559342.1 hypothetical protein HRR79_008365 [Exophiala dermatitidis]